MTEQPYISASFSGSVSDAGRPKFDEPARVVARLLRLFRGSRVDITFSREKKRRNLEQNRLLWSYYHFIAEWSGHSAEEIHDALKVVLLGVKDLALPGGESLGVARSTATLTPAEFSEYVDRVRLWAAELGLRLPVPGEEWEVEG